ncbi:molecular chaperone [Herbaspirillum sp. SJZ107]|uniref:TorD/DmsD family molecular chaperone n=1 Tax=Herbaspirillum sp. SJZ107 TaxID=2572881 RepID=UPI00115406E8|nr:molecular chaperone TorD family protein [Herbaspirillum sp. SJZ107]TQK03179.1 TorA maturation chaperone TorD [Herbaspirillum sp. SJZ107]
MVPQQPDASVNLPLGGEDQARADFYALLARLLLAPPDSGLLAALAESEPISAAGEFALEDAWLKLTQAASVVDAGAASDEFTLLFLSTGNPLLNPFGSFYLTGHLNDVPLVQLRHDLARLRLARAPGAGESEDHLGALCETMRVLIQGAPGIGRQPLLAQKQFFEAHIRPWYAACLADIAHAEGANFYRVVAAVADAFLSIEAQAFSVLDADDLIAA